MEVSRSRPLRVAVVYPIPFGEQGLFGGGERYAVELARALSRLTPTQLVSFTDRNRTYREDDLEVRLYRPLLYVRGARNNPLSLRFLKALRRADVIHCTSWNTLVTDLAILFARTFRKRVFVTDIGGGAGVTLTRRLSLERRVDGFLPLSETGIGHLDPARTRLIYAGIDTERYRPDPGRGRSGVVFVGRLLPHKGVDDLIAAMDPGIPLHVIGRPYHEGYFELLQRLAAGKDVTFVTDASDDEVLRFYQSSAVAVLPSVYRTVYGDHVSLPELLGLAAMEAMACATPVVCTRVGGLREVVEDGVSGFLVPPNDPVALGEKLRLLLSDSQLAARIGAAARRHIERQFTWPRVAERCIDAYGASWPAGDETRVRSQAGGAERETHRA